MTTYRANTSNSETDSATGSRDLSNALDVFMATKFQIHAILERLKALSNDHFETDPDEINCGDVGNLNHYANLLRKITDAAFKEGEHAALSRPVPPDRTGRPHCRVGGRTPCRL